jgi:4-amino-4-deoxy-L-arabinose transferase-like glycosyltransferase
LKLGLRPASWAPPVTLAVVGGAIALWRLPEVGFGNLYYAAAVRSMTLSWHNLLFAAFDPAGFVSVDKPPLDLWLQSLAAHLIGYRPLALLLPQALAGAAAPIVLFSILRGSFGAWAAFIGGVVLMLTPVSVAVERYNTLESVLVLLMLLAVAAGLRGIRSGRLRWWVMCGLALGLAFETKLWAGMLVVPALVLAAMVGSQPARRQMARGLGLALVLAAAASAAWPLAVDLTPATARPYVGGSQGNHEWQLILGYNGVGRLVSPPGASSRDAAGAVVTQPVGGPNGGAPGLLRLLGQGLADQGGWFIPAAVGGTIVALLAVRREEVGAARAELLLWASWLITDAIVFSAEGGTFHPYYLAEAAPATAAVVGIGAAAALSRPSRGRWVWPLPIMIAATALWQAWMVATSSVVMPVLLGLAAAATGLAALLGWLAADPGARRLVLARVCAGACAVLLLAAPAVWVGITIANPPRGLAPYAGPELLRQAAGDRELPISATRSPLSILAKDRGSWAFLVATPTARTAAPLIVDSGEPVMAMGGFAGADPILASTTLDDLLRRGVVRYFLLPEDPSRVEAPAAEPVVDEVRGRCQEVFRVPPQVLYRCAPASGAES